MGKILSAEADQKGLSRKKQEADAACLADPESERKRAEAAFYGAYLARANDALLRLKAHRYIDDLESLIYVHIWQVSATLVYRLAIVGGIRSL